MFFLLRRGRNGAEVSTSADKCLWRLCFEPMNNFSQDNDRGGCRLSIGAVFLTKGVMHEAVILWPSHSHSIFANSYLGSLSAIF